MPFFVTPPLQKVRPSQLALCMTKQPRMVETHKTKKKSNIIPYHSAKPKLYIEITNNYTDMLSLLCCVNPHEVDAWIPSVGSPSRKEYSNEYNHLTEHNKQSNSAYQTFCNEIVTTNGIETTKLG